MKIEWKLRCTFLAVITCSIIFGQNTQPQDSIDFNAIDSVEQRVENAILGVLQYNYINFVKTPVILDVRYDYNFEERVFYYTIVLENELTADIIKSGKFRRKEIQISGEWRFLRYEDDLLYIDVAGKHQKTQFQFSKYYGTTEQISFEKININKILTINTVGNVHLVSIYKITSGRDLYKIGTLRPLTYIDLQYLTMGELAYLRNEFYARKGYIFKTEKMENYFADKEWYKPRYDDVNHLMSQIELQNVYFIKSVEEGEKLLQDCSAISTLYRIGTTRKLTQDDLAGLNVHELSYLRNEFYARKGYIFKTVKMQNYFSQMPWYNPCVSNADGLLSDLEMDNVLFIKEFEEQNK